MSEEKKLEMVYEVLTQAKNMIGQIYKPEGAISIRYDDFTDEAVRDCYYRINEMCGGLLDRKVFPWQKEDNEDKD